MILDSDYSDKKAEGFRHLMQSLTLTRFIGDAPPNWLNSVKFAEIAEDIAQELGLQCEIKGRKEIIEMVGDKLTLN